MTNSFNYNRKRFNIDTESQLELIKLGLLSVQNTSLKVTPTLLSYLENQLIGFNWQETQDYYHEKKKRDSRKPKKLWNSQE